MSLRRVGILLRREVVDGSKSFMFVFAIVAPVALSLVLSLAFGTLFSEKPKLGIADVGSSRLVQLIRELDAVAVREYAAGEELKEAVAAGAIDMGIILPQGLDRDVTQGLATELAAYVWGESLAKNRVILGITLGDAIITLTGHEVPVEITTTTLGGSENVPWNERLLPLIVLIAVFMAGVMTPSTSLVNEKQKRTLVALTTTPTTLEEVLLSKGLLGLGLSLVVAGLTLALNQAFGARPWLLLLVLALGAAMATGIGLLLGLLVNDISSLFATNKSMGLILYAPAFVYLFPQVPQWIGKLFPTYYVIQPLMEISLRGGSWPDVAREVLILVGLILVLLAGVVAIARRSRHRVLGAASG